MLSNPCFQYNAHWILLKKGARIKSYLISYTLANQISLEVLAKIDFLLQLLHIFTQITYWKHVCLYNVLEIKPALIIHQT
jgi:hypothetical protein